MSRLIKIYLVVIISISLFSVKINAQSDNLLTKLITTADSSKSSLYSNLAYIYMDSAGLAAINFSINAIKYAEENNQEEKLAYAHIMLGSSYMAKSEFAKSLEAFEAAEKISSKINNYYQLHTIYNNIGVIYKYNEKYDIALDYYSKALYNADLCHDSQSIIQTYTNIGNIYVIKNELENGLIFYNKAIDESKLLDSLSSNLASIYNNIGYVHFMNNDYDRAYNSYTIAYTYFEKLSNYYGMAVILNNLAEINIKNKKFSEAESKINKADSLHNLLNYNDSRKNLYYTAYQLYYESADYKRSINYLQKYQNLKDSIYNLELDEKINLLQTEYEVEKLRNETQTKDYKIEQQNKTNISLIIGISAVSILLVLLIIIFKQKQKQNILLRIKDFEISENLNYARKIQKSCMLNTNITDKNYFILDLPKSTVGGDFYLIRNNNNRKYFALADATGHGISGGFLSIMGIQFLNNAIDKYSDIDDIINHLNINFFNYITKSNSLMKESLSISLVYIENNNVYYGGSKQKIWKYSKNSQELLEYKTSAQIIGNNKDNKFAEESFTVEEGDIIFMSSDGYPDQFGSSNKGKYKYHRFRNLLKIASQKDISTISNFIKTELNTWKAEKEQTDDILVIGIKK